MLHDRQFKSAQVNAMDMALIYRLNHYAAALLWRVRDAERMGHAILNREWLGTQFNKRQWTLATKGTRPMDGRKVIDKAPAPDGLEFYGVIVSEQSRDREGRTKTVWLIGSVAAEQLEEKLRERDEYLSADTVDDVIEDDSNGETEDDNGLESQQPSETVRSAFKRGVQHGKIIQQARSVENEIQLTEESMQLGKLYSDREWLETLSGTRSVQYTPLSKDNKREYIALLAQGHFELSEMRLRAESEKDLGF